MVGSISAIISYLVEATDKSNRGGFVWEIFFLIFSPLVEEADYILCPHPFLLLMQCAFHL